MVKVVLVVLSQYRLIASSDEGISKYYTMYSIYGDMGVLWLYLVYVKAVLWKNAFALHAWFLLFAHICYTKFLVKPKYIFKMII